MSCTRMIWKKKMNSSCSSRQKASAARNWINFVPQAAATTFAFLLYLFLAFVPVTSQDGCWTINFDKSVKWHSINKAHNTFDFLLLLRISRSVAGLKNRARHWRLIFQLYRVAIEHYSMPSAQGFWRTTKYFINYCCWRKQCIRSDCVTWLN